MSRHFGKGRPFIWPLIFMALIGAWMMVERHSPTADELFGCTARQQSDNGECK